MHSAPSVTYPVGRSRFLGRMLAALWLAGAGVTALGWHSFRPDGWRVGVACAVLLLAAFMARHLWQAIPAGELHWDGHAWQAPGNHVLSPGLRVHLDLQRHLLVRLHGESVAGRWIWLSATSSPARWNDLRRAVYSRAVTDARRDAAMT